MKDKSSSREEMRSLLDQVSSVRLTEASEKVCQHLCNSTSLLHKAKTIAIFSALENEINLSPLRELLPEARLLYPLCHKGGILTFHHVSHPVELTSGMLGILEPIPEQHPEVTIGNIDLFLCPGLAFGKDGSRLGQGGGFYDRALAKKKITARAIGIGIELQVLGSVPFDQHDIKMDYLATELGIHKTG